VRSLCPVLASSPCLASARSLWWVRVRVRVRVGGGGGGTTACGWGRYDCLQLGVGGGV